MEYFIDVIDSTVKKATEYNKRFPCDFSRFCTSFYLLFIFKHRKTFIYSQLTSAWKDQWHARIQKYFFLIQKAIVLDQPLHCSLGPPFLLPPTHTPIVPPKNKSIKSISNIQTYNAYKYINTESGTLTPLFWKNFTGML